MAQLLEVGIAQADITPPIGLPLSGFISRMGKPSETIDGPLTVSVLILRTDGQNAFLLDYTLLSIGQDLEEKILAHLEGRFGSDFSRQRCAILTIHTHSAPPVAPLEGEFPIDPDYERLLLSASLQAAENALASLEPCTLSFASVRLPGLTYNRRAVLADGRVSLSAQPDGLVLERGPVDDTLSALVWQTASGQNKAVLLHFACHAAATCTQGVSADIPGEFMRRAEQLFQSPCLYLQGATGDINPTVIATSREEMLAWVEQAWPRLQDLPALLQPLSSLPLQIQAARIPLEYRPFPPRAQVVQRLSDLWRIAAGELDDPALQPTLVQFADLMNYQPGVRPDAQIASLMAGILARTEERALQAIDQGDALPKPLLGVQVWSLGQLALVFISAEVFAITGFRLRALGRGQAVLPVSYASNILGYLPDRESLPKGGYEVDNAWRFYRHPAPFAADSEDRLVATVRGILEQQALAR
jgi:neutral ceramidase